MFSLVARRLTSAQPRLLALTRHPHFHFSRIKFLSSRAAGRAVAEVIFSNTGDSDVQKYPRRGGVVRQRMSCFSARALVDDYVDVAPARVLILYGSQTGTAHLMADDLQAHAEAKGHVADAMGMDEISGAEAVERCIREGAVLTFIISNFGKGEPADNARAMYNWLTAPERAAADSVDRAVDWQRLRFAVFGLGQSIAYAKNYQRVGIALDERLAALGARRVAPRGAGDASHDADEDFDAWQETELWPALQQIVDSAATADAPAAFSASAAPSAEAVFVGEPRAAASTARTASANVAVRLPPHFYDQQAAGEAEATAVAPDTARPRWCELVQHERLTPVTSFRQINRLVFDLDGGAPGSGSSGSQNPPKLTYTTGDYAGVLPSNPPEQVTALADRLELPLDAGVAAMGGNSFGDVLRRYCDISGAPRRNMLRRLAPFAAEDAERRELLHLAADTEEGKAAFKRDIAANKVSVAELFSLFPSLHPDAASLVDICPPIQPRFYSISSSSLARPRRLELTVGLHAYSTPTGRAAVGLASHFLTSVAHSGDRVPLFVQRSGYHLPEDDSLPVVLVGVGSGIAPLRAFIEERAWKARRGDAVGPVRLYFGAAAPAVNDLYSDWLDEVRASGVLQLRKVYSDWPVVAAGNAAAGNAIAVIAGKAGPAVAPPPPALAPRFVQHLIDEDAAELYDLVTRRGGRIFVCGHSMLGSGVGEALRRMLRRHGGAADDAAAQETLEAWKEAGVLNEDIFL